MYKQNLLNLFLSSVQKRQCPSPLCDCSEGVQSGFHVVTACPLVDEALRETIQGCMITCNDQDCFDQVVDDYTSVLNCSRSKIFILSCISIIEKNKPSLKSEFIIDTNQ